MSKDKDKTSNNNSKSDLKEENLTQDDFKTLLEKNVFKVPKAGDLVKGDVISASKAEVKLDIEGVITGIVRGPELYEDDDDYANLKPGDNVEATVIEGENENGELELSFRYAGQEKAWAGLHDALDNRKIIKVKIIDANKGGLLVKYRQIPGFLPVSQLASENYPRVNGGDKGKILEKLRSFVNNEFEVKIMTLDERDDKIIFSEKEAWNEKQRDVISKYKVGTVVEGKITAITDFGVFISFGENLEGLIHISELAWQRIDDPADLFKVSETIKAEVISLDDAKIFLSLKKLLKDPWQNVGEKYKVGQVVVGIILKVNPFGLFVKLDKDIHGLAHISQLNLAPGERINSIFKHGEKINLEIVSMEPKDHRLGLAVTKKAIEAKPSFSDEEDGNNKKKSSSASSSAKASVDKKATEGKEKKDKKVKVEDIKKKSKADDKKVKATKTSEKGESKAKKEAKSIIADEAKAKSSSAKALEDKKAKKDKEKKSENKTTKKAEKKIEPKKSKK